MLVIAGETMSSYGMLVPSMITISVASVIIGAHIIYRSQPATRADCEAVLGPGPCLHVLHDRGEALSHGRVGRAQHQALDVARDVVVRHGARLRVFPLLCLHDGHRGRVTLLPDVDADGRTPHRDGFRVRNGLPF